jgi:hypothetical protein
LLRLVFFIGIGLLVAGSCLIGDYRNPSSVKLGAKLAKAGYIVFVVILAGLAGFTGKMWLKKGSLGANSERVSYSNSKEYKALTECVDRLCNHLFHSVLSRTDGVCVPFSFRVERKMESS